MCESIEAYANDRAINATIKACVDFGKDKEQTVDYVKNNYPNASETYIISRYTLLWENRTEQE